jgi:hypothetical protein
MPCTTVNAQQLYVKNSNKKIQLHQFCQKVSGGLLSNRGTKITAKSETTADLWDKIIYQTESYPSEVKLSSCMPWRCLREEVYFLFIFYLGTRRVSSQHHALAVLCSRGEDPWYPLDTRKKSFGLAGNLTLLIQSTVKTLY